MASGDGTARPRVSLANRAKFLGRSIASAMSRYPRDLVRSMTLRRGGNPAHSLARDWAALAGEPGLTGITGLAWLGHCTVLIKIGAITILTDPVLSEFIGPKVGGKMGVTIGSRRIAPAVARVRDLPRPDLILVSHAHYDHLDRPTLKGLVSRKTHVVTALRTRNLIPRGFGSVHEIHWERQISVAGVRIEAVRPKHWGARNAWDRHRGYNSYVFEAGGARVLFAGDTALTHNFDDLAPIDLAIFGIGAYDPWEHAHATPEQVWEMARACGARLVFPVHHSTFKLSNEPVGEPLERLIAAAGRERDRLVILDQGTIMSGPI